MYKSKEWNRRKFLRNLTASAALLPGTSLFAEEATKERYQLLEKTYSANDDIQIGLIGCGIQGFGNARTATKIPGVKIIMACDLYHGHLDSIKEQQGDHIITTTDYREVLANDAIDAIILSVPDHWHDHIAIAALEAGKHVYCEKPMVHKLEEGQAVIDAAKKSGKVLQVGSQRVSSIVYEKARELFREGVIGELNLADIKYDRHNALGAWQYSIPPDASPETIDWDAFLGDAPKRAFDKTRFFRWRNYQEYGTGMAGDLFVHLFSGLHLITDAVGPERIYATGGLRYWKDGRDVPDVLLGSYDYGATDHHTAFNVQMRCNFVDGGGGGSSVRLIGSEGVMTLRGRSLQIERNPMASEPGYGNWDTYATFSKATQKDFKAWYDDKYASRTKTAKLDDIEFNAPSGYSSHLDHHMNFLEAIRKGGQVTEDATFGLRAAGPALACNMSYFEKKVVQWDPIAMKVLDS